MLRRARLSTFEFIPWWNALPEERLVPISLDGYVAFYAALAVVIAILYWLLQKREKRARKKFFEQFDPSELRMSPYKIGLVYSVIQKNENLVTVVPIWREKSRIIDGKEQALDPSDLMPFDETRFF